jgi:hypothetical protein
MNEKIRGRREERKEWCALEDDNRGLPLEE